MSESQFDALALQTLQVAGQLAPADQHRAYSAIATKDIATMAAIVALSKGGIVAGGNVTINNIINSHNSHDHRESSQYDGRATTFEGLDGRVVLACFAVMLAILSVVKVGETATNLVHAVRGTSPIQEVRR